jgi:RNA polymerase sigma-70 factor (ECF subfamily)
VPDTAPGPQARVERREAISLAFVTAMQSLPPRQRAVLVLRDVLGFRAAEVAEMLDTTEESVTSALKRARAAMPHERPARVGGAQERALATAFADAMERGDVPAMLALLTDDAWLTMPPAPLQYQGHQVIGEFMRMVTFRGGARRYRLISTSANGQPAFGLYGYDNGETVGHARGVLVLTLQGDRVSAITRFDNSVMPYFGLPATLPADR